ncbi:MAG: four helix bundle protein [Verrucomicrobia bacterium]|nr:MAG: four helix bundle protein [Verrucomicrobiota bacterium]
MASRAPVRGRHPQDRPLVSGQPRVDRRGVGEVAGNRERGAWGTARDDLTEKLFRFEDPGIWTRAAATSLRLFVLADDSEMRRQYRFAEQPRAATRSVTHNIAEGSGSTSDAEFAQFLDIVRRSVYEVPTCWSCFPRTTRSIPRIPNRSFWNSKDRAA